MADDPNDSTPQSTNPDDTLGKATGLSAAPESEGFLHSLATSLGIDPEAVKATAKVALAHPLQVAQEVGSEAASEIAGAGASGKAARETAKTAAKGVEAAATNPEAKITAKTRFAQPGLANKAAGALEYLTSGLPLVGGNLTKAEEQAAQGNIAGSVGTTAGTVAPFLVGGEAAEEAAAPSKALAEPSAPDEAGALTRMNRDTVKSLQDLGYSNQQITNFNIGDIHKIVTEKIPAPEAGAESAAAASAESKASATAKTPAATEKTQNAEVPAHITFDELGGQEVKAPDLNPPQRPGAFRTPIKPSPAERADRIEDLKNLTNSPNAIEAKNAKELLKTVYGVTGSEISPVVQSTAEWKPPAGLKEGIPSTTPVDTQIPLEKISVSPRQYSAASSDIARGAGSHTTEPIRILYNPDNGQFLVEDGMHRLVEAHQRGETTIPAKLWSGYSDTVANVHGDRMDLSPNEPETDEGQEQPAPQFDQTLARRGQMPGQTVNLADAYGDTGHYVGGLIQHRLAVNPENGNLKPQEQYLQRLGTTTGLDLMSIPQSRLTGGSTTHDVISHELGHAVMAHLMGLPTDDIEVMSHQHPDAGRGAAAAITLPMNKMSGAIVNPQTGAVRFTPEALEEHWPKFLNTYLAGGVMQELAHGLPFEMNEGTNGDFQQIHKIGKIMGFTPDEVDDMVKAHLAETRSLLDHPGTLDAIRQAAGEREEGLSKALHVSAGKVQDVIKGVMEARNGQKGIVSTGRGDNGALATETEPQKAGSGSQGNVREGDREAVSPVAEVRKSPEQNLTLPPKDRIWFGKSRVTDDSGAPLKVYHGASPARPFDRPIKNDRYTTGRFFSSSPDVAGAYGPDVIPAILKMENPFIVDAQGHTYSRIPVPKEMRKWVHESMETVESDNIAEWAHKNGYDGVIIKNVVEPKHPKVADDYIVFKSSQIKKVNASPAERVDQESNGEAVSPVAESNKKVNPLPPQPKLPDEGQYAAIQTDDGGIYPDLHPEKQRTHVMLAQDLGIPAERIVSGGWLNDGTYEGSERSDAGRYGERARAKLRVDEKKSSPYLENPKAARMRDMPVYQNDPQKFTERYGSGQEWYHGTTADFDDFKHEGVERGTTDWNSHLGTHFAADPSTADEFAEGRYTGKTGGKVIPAKLKIQNPKQYDFEGEMGDDALKAAIRDKIVTPADIKKVSPYADPNNIDHNGNGIIQALRSKRNKIASNFKQDLKSQGYDGIIYGNVVEGGFGGRTAIAFEPEQIERTDIGRTLYHGTSKTFSGFDSSWKKASATGNPTGELGTFFTKLPGEAERYVKDFHGGKGQVVDARVNLKNPYEMSMAEFHKLSTPADLSKWDWPEMKARNVDFRNHLQTEGHDGIIVGKGRDYEETIVFDPKKSVTVKNVRPFNTTPGWMDAPKPK